MCESGGIVPVVRDVSTRWGMSSQLHPPSELLYQAPIQLKAGHVSESVCSLEKNRLLLLGIWSRDFLSFSVQTSHYIDLAVQTSCVAEALPLKCHPRITFLVWHLHHMGTVICHPCEDLLVLNLSLSSVVFRLPTSGFNTYKYYVLLKKMYLVFGGSQKKKPIFPPTSTDCYL